MTDHEVAEYFGTSVSTLRRRLASPAKGEVNPNDARPQIVFGRRYWLRERVENLLEGADK